MQLTTLLLAALSAVSVSATPSWMGGDQVTIKEEWKVPGDNPLYFCGDPKDDIAQIENVDLDPNPPKPYVCPRPPPPKGLVDGQGGLHEGCGRMTTY